MHTRHKRRMRYAAATDARLLSTTSNARVARGRGRFAVERLPYFGDKARELLTSIANVILVGTPVPATFIA
jgi:acetolactate synthase-1/2/3 large subunit